jgi:hypothetical protein
MTLKELKLTLKARGDLYDEREIPEKQRGRKGVSALARYRVSSPPHGDAKEREEWDFDAAGELLSHRYVKG